jgi:hypothetical protein
MDAAAARSKPQADDLILEHCLALDPDRRRPPARARLDEILGCDLARRLVVALCPTAGSRQTAA